MYYVYLIILGFIVFVFIAKILKSIIRGCITATLFVLFIAIVLYYLGYRADFLSSLYNLLP